MLRTTPLAEIAWSIRVLSAIKSDPAHRVAMRLGAAVAALHALH